MNSTKVSLFGCGLVAVILAGGCADTERSDVPADEVEHRSAQALAQPRNGLVQIKELGSDAANTAPGLASVLGLTTSNGLTRVGTEMHLNPLASWGGSPVVDGKSVNCHGKSLSDCTGVADGLMSNQTGLMNSSGNGSLATAVYIVRCALDSTQYLRLRQKGGSTTSLQGQLGLAPEWLDGKCDIDCQQAVSACLLALTNGTGDSVDVTLSSWDMPIGPGMDANYPRQEGAFWGNVFGELANTNYCRGVNDVAFRNCQNDSGQYLPGSAQCRYRYRGLCSSVCTGYSRHTWSDCGTKDNVITVHRK